MRVMVALALAWGFLLGAQQTYAYVTTSARFEARVVEFVPTKHITRERLDALMGLVPGTNILAVDVAALARQVETDPWVADATVERQLPDTLRISVREHDPAAVVLAGHFYLINRDGVPFKRVEPGERGSLPVITGVAREWLVRGEPAAHQVIQRGLAVLSAYEAKARPRLSEIHIGDGGEVQLYTEKTGTLLRLGRGPVADRLARFDALRAALGDRADKLSVVHLDAQTTADRGDRVIASFVDANEAAVLLADATPRAAATPAPALAAEPPVKHRQPVAPPSGTPAKKQGKRVKQTSSKLQGVRKFPSGIPKYD